MEKEKGNTASPGDRKRENGFAWKPEHGGRYTFQRLEDLEACWCSGMTVKRLKGFASREGHDRKTGHVVIIKVQ